MSGLDDSPLTRTLKRMSRSMLPLVPRIVRHIRLSDDMEILNYYDFGSALGQGSFGTVYLAKNKETGKEYAMKVIEKARAGTLGCRMLDNEMQVMRLLTHDAIIQLEETFESGKKAYLVLELCRGGTLRKKFLREDRTLRFSDRQIAGIIKSVASAVAYLHDLGIAHRDLKLDNILLANDSEEEIHVKIIDFGLSAMKDKETQLQLACGTPYYMAPEVLSDQGNYTPLCDIWSLGVILYQLLSGTLPFRASEETMLDTILNHPVEFPSEYWSNIDHGASSLVRNMLQIDPSRRVTAKEVLCDNWIQGTKSDFFTGTVLDMMRQWTEEEARVKALNDELHQQQQQQQQLQALSAAALLPVTSIDSGSIDSLTRLPTPPPTPSKNSPPKKLDPLSPYAERKRFTLPSKSHIPPIESTKKRSELMSASEPRLTKTPIKHSTGPLLPIAKSHSKHPSRPPSSDGKETAKHAVKLEPILQERLVIHRK